jgi:Fic family protein
MENDSQFRSGRYIQQPTGYKVFIPAPLPPKPTIRTDGELSEHLSSANLALGRLDGSIQTLPNPDLFVFMYVRKEAVLSSQIEGTQSSLNDLLAAEASILNPTQPKDVDVVVNYVHAMNYGLQRLSELPLSVRLVREIHAQLLKGVRGSGLTPGELRRTQNWIGHAGCTLTDASFVPPPPDEVPALLGQWESFLHQPSRLPHLVEIGLAHAQFETIHPFLDGNGRVGRLLITFLLCQRGILLKPVLYLSHYFKLHRTEYYDRLQSVRDNGDWEGWLSFFLQGVSSVSAEATDTARRILVLREEHRAKVTQNLGRAAGNGHMILEHLFQKPIIEIDDVRKLTGTTYQASNNLVARMTECGILREMTGNKRNRLFRYAPYIELFG